MTYLTMTHKDGIPKPDTVMTYLNLAQSDDILKPDIQ